MLSSKKERIQDIVDLKSDFINEQRFMVEILLKEIVNDKIADECPASWNKIILKMFYYTYVLKSSKDKKHYTGFTKKIKGKICNA